MSDVHSVMLPMERLAYHIAFVGKACDLGHVGWAGTYPSCTILMVDILARIKNKCFCGDATEYQDFERIRTERQATHWARHCEFGVIVHKQFLPLK